jgi:hypothetical protein
MRMWPLSYRLVGAGSFDDQLRQTLDNFGLVSANADDADILIDLTGYGEAASPVLADEAALRWQGMTVFRTGASGLRLEYQGWRVEIDAERRAVRPVALGFGADDYLDYQCRSFLRIALLFLVRRLGYFELHAGACALGDAGYVLIGASGRGKTSAVLALVEAGWKYVGDDALLARVQDAETDCVKREEIVLASARHRFSLTAEALERRRTLQAHAVRAVKKIDKWVIDPLAVWPDQRLLEVRPAVIVFCEIHDAETTTVTSVPPPIALSRLMASTPWIALDRETSGNHIHVYRRMVETCRSVEMRAGRDVLRSPHILAELLASESVTATLSRSTVSP